MKNLKSKLPLWRYRRTHASERGDEGATGVIAKGKVWLFQELGRHIDLMELLVDRIQFAVFGIDAAASTEYIEYAKAPKTMIATPVACPPDRSLALNATPINVIARHGQMIFGGTCR